MEKGVYISKARVIYDMTVDFAACAGTDFSKRKF